MKIKLSLVFSAFSTLSAGYQSSKLIEKALSESPMVKSADFSIKEKDRLVQAAKAKFMPNATLSASTLLKDPNNCAFSDFESHRSSQIKIAITQKIFDPTAIVENKLAKINKNISQINAELDATKFREEIETNFSKAWLEQERKCFIDQLWKTSVADLERDLKKAKSGLLNKVQVSSNLAKFNDNKKQVLKYSISLGKAFSELEKAVGVPIFDNGAHPQLYVDDLGVNEEQIQPRQFYLDKALENRRELAVLGQQIALEDKNSDLAISGYLPSISGLASVDGLKNHHVDKTADWHGHVGLSANWNFFDGAGHKFQSEAALARKFRADQNLQLLKMRIHAQISGLFDSMQEKLKDLDSSKSKLVEQKSLFDKKMLEFKLGLISKNEAEHTKLDWLKTQFDWLETKIGLKIAQNQLNFGCGSFD